MKLKMLSLTALIGMLTAAPGLGQVGANTAVLNPNLATEKELAEVPHLDDELIERLVAQRPFLKVGELHEVLVKKLKDEQIQAVYEKMFVPLNLNTASEEDILRVPRVGKKMAHEFEEYRPYRKLAQFRREMGKYVDDEEVARLEQFVFVPMDLNEASEEDFLSIPGVGKKICHEFMEYRPYVSIEQFRREIGKYVDDKEVARLERYVFVVAPKGQ